jgi:hypothetical protein
MRKLIVLTLLAAGCGVLGGNEGFGGGSRITVADQLSALSGGTLFVEMSDKADICGDEQGTKVKASSKRLTFEFSANEAGTFTVWDQTATQPAKWVKVTFEQFDGSCAGSETGAYTGTVTLSAVGATVTGSYDVSFRVLSGSDQVEKGNINAASCDLSGASGSKTCI